ncbi:MAG: hypothetical protein QM695_08180 [Micropruina sp.]
MEEPSNADDGQATSSRRTPGSPGEPGTPSKLGRTWRGPGGIRISVIGLVGILVVVAGIVIVVVTGNAAFGSGVVIAGFGVLLIDALRAR